MLTRPQLAEKVLLAKIDTGLTWSALAEKIGSSKEWCTAALLGQCQMTEAEASAAVAALGLGEDDKKVLMAPPYRGAAFTVPTDPFIYRFHEIMQVYGNALREVTQEEFGDGIMSAIDFSATVDRVADPKGDRVKITFEGKFLPYKKW